MLEDGQARSRLPEGDRAVGLTREKWLAVLLRELNFGRVPTRPAGGLVIDDRSFPISHVYEAGAATVPLHLLGEHLFVQKSQVVVEGLLVKPRTAHAAGRGRAVGRSE